MAVLDMACVDFCVENVAYLGLAQQKALDAPCDWLVAYVLLDGKVVLGGNHALIVGGGCSSSEREGAFCLAWASLCKSYRTCPLPHPSGRPNAGSPRG